MRSINVRSSFSVLKINRHAKMCIQSSLLATSSIVFLVKQISLFHLDLFYLFADSSGHVSPKKMGLLLHDQLQVVNV